MRSQGWLTIFGVTSIFHSHTIARIVHCTHALSCAHAFVVARVLYYFKDGAGGTSGRCKFHMKAGFVLCMCHQTTRKVMAIAHCMCAKMWKTFPEVIIIKDHYFVLAYAWSKYDTPKVSIRNFNPNHQWFGLKYLKDTFRATPQSAVGCLFHSARKQWPAAGGH